MEQPLMNGSIELVLASHTNVGKTSLARTLLGRDVGDVRDEAHVTEFSDRYTWQETPQGEALKLWDTPGFGDSLRLLKRVRQSGTLRGWILTNVWDRWLFPGFHFSQKALRTIQDEADVVLYLVSASEPPAVLGYLESEMQLLELTDKPVIALINQLGTEQNIEQELADVEQWEAFFRQYPHVFRVLPLDAFARCWVQEYALLELIHAALQDQERRERMLRICNEWRAEKLQLFDESMSVLTGFLVDCALARQPVAVTEGRLGSLLDQLNVRKNISGAQQKAEAALTAGLRQDTEETLAKLLGLHHLDATVENDIGEELQQIYHPAKRVSESKATVVVSVASGMLGGLLADIMAGGLTLGGGMLLGGLAGALGGKAVATGYNRVYDKEQSWVEWDAESLNKVFARAVMCYLIIAHAGRGRGKAVLKREHPRWLKAVPEAVAAIDPELLEIWTSRAPGSGENDTGNRIHQKLRPLLTEVTWSVLEALYPVAGTLRQSPRGPWMTGLEH
jgi:hypothetical protein